MNYCNLTYVNVFHSNYVVGTQTASRWFNWFSRFLRQSVGWNRRMWVYNASFTKSIDSFSVEIQLYLSKHLAFSGFLEDPSYFILWLALIVVGSVHLNDCLAEPMLPIFLVVFGNWCFLFIPIIPTVSIDFKLSLLLWILGVVGLLVQIIQELNPLLEVTGGWEIAQIVCTYLMVSFLIGWYFTGNVLSLSSERKYVMPHNTPSI